MDFSEKREIRDASNEVEGLFKELGKEPFHNLNVAFALMSIIPFLAFLYLLTARLFSINILTGDIGFIVSVTFMIACFGYFLGYSITRNILKKITNYAVTIRATFAELKETQAMLIRAEQFKAVGQLASGVAHEVKNPLGVLLQNVIYLEDTLPEDNATRNVLDMMRRNINRADTIVRSLLDFSRSSKIERRRQLVNPLVHSSISLLQHRLKYENIDFDLQLKEGLPPVKVDSMKMEQVLINILMNSIQAMPIGGTICIKTYLMTVETEKRGMGDTDEVFFTPGDTAIGVEVGDNGPGITKSNLRKIFEPFFTTKDIGQGTGLGLSVTRNIVELHKGLIDIESTEGKGTKVRIMLKACKENENE